MGHHPFGTVKGFIGPRLPPTRSRGFLFVIVFVEALMKRVIAFVDGFNLYHSLADNPVHEKYKWLAIRKLLGMYVPAKELKETYYFTSLTTWNLEKVARHKILIRAFEQVGAKIVYGEFRKRDRYCPNCKSYYVAREEKQTDVNIAIHLFRLAIKDRYDTAVILSGDSDLIPSIKAVKATFPSKQVGILIPMGRRAEELKANRDFDIRIREKNLAKCQFEDPLPMPDGSKLSKPSAWA